MSEEKPHKAWDSVKTVLGAVAIAMCVRVGIAQAYVVEGPSMEPSLANSEHVVVLRAAYGLSVPGRSQALLTWSLPEAGDVVIIESPSDGLDLVKRVIGLPGDVIEVRSGELYRNDERIAQEDLRACVEAEHIDLDPGCRVYQERLGDRRWTISQSALFPGEDAGPWTVPEGHVFIAGDHRDRSNDSRTFGPVPASNLRGRVLFID